MIEVEKTIPEDIVLLEKVGNGNQQAFNILFEKYWESTYSNAYKRLKNEHDAKDIVQEIFTHIWIKRESIDIHNLPAYLHVAVRNKVFKMLAKQKTTHPFLELINNIPERNCRADTNLLWKEFFNSYQALLKTLPPKRQKIFRLRYDEDIATKDIADQLGISRKTVQNQLGKAIETLKISLSRVMIIAFSLL
jgi:RNA polymerase sigma-70 factor (family 1)